MIIPGVASQVLAAELATATGRHLMEIDRRRFPDDERLVELRSSPGREAIVVASTTSDAAHMDLLLLQDAAREAGVKDLTTVIPYLGYARQDAAFEGGQPVSVRAIAKAVSSSTDRVLTINPHETDVLSHFDVPAHAICIADRLASALPSDLEDPVFLGPDEGARELAESLQASHGEGDADHLVKTRLSDREIEVDPATTDLRHRDIVLIDDIIATGGTMIEATRMSRERGAGRVIAACVHPILADDAYVRLHRAGIDGLVATDTVERLVSRCTAAPAVARALRDL